MTSADARLAEYILRDLRKHVGQANAISARGLARYFILPKLSDRSIRRIISAHWERWAEAGTIVCSKSGGGFWVAADYEEAVAYRDWIADSGAHLTRRAALITRLCRKHGLRLPKHKKGTPCPSQT